MLFSATTVLNFSKNKFLLMTLSYMTPSTKTQFTEHEREETDIIQCQKTCLAQFAASFDVLARSLSQRVSSAKHTTSIAVAALLRSTE